MSLYVWVWVERVDVSLPLAIESVNWLPSCWGCELKVYSCIYMPCVILCRLGAALWASWKRCKKYQQRKSNTPKNNILFCRCAKRICENFHQCTVHILTVWLVGYTVYVCYVNTGAALLTQFLTFWLLLYSWQDTHLNSDSNVISIGDILKCEMYPV